MPLYERHCLADISPQLLTTKQLNQYHEEVPLWELDKENNKIYRTFNFNNYHQTLKFINHIAEIINKENHHPEITFGYSYCNISFSTHSANGITLFDFICAAHIDKLYSPTEINL